MSQYHEYLHQKARLIDYRDQISGCLFHMHRILTTYFPDSNISAVIEIQNMVDEKLQDVIQNVNNDGV